MCEKHQCVEAACLPGARWKHLQREGRDSWACRCLFPCFLSLNLWSCNPHLPVVRWLKLALDSKHNTIPFKSKCVWIQFLSCAPWITCCSGLSSLKLTRRHQRRISFFNNLLPAFDLISFRKRWPWNLHFYGLGRLFWPFSILWTPPWKGMFPRLQALGTWMWHVRFHL